MSEALAERAAIVEYLRWVAARQDKLAKIAGQKFSGRFHAEACRMAAQHIKLGVHLFPADPDEDDVSEGDNHASIS
jgi:hypothetical protein